MLGPGLLESSYRKCLYRELFIRHIPFQKEWPLPLNYKGLRLDCGYRMDVVVARQIVVEVKSVEALAPIHEAQLFFVHESFAAFFNAALITNYRSQ